MKAAVMQGLHRPLAIETVADPSPGEGEVVVSVGRCGICGSDLHMLEDPVFNARPGDILGHEFAGEVVALGKGAQGLRPGDMVTVSPLKSCGHCDFCRKGEVQWCTQFGLQGGGYAEFALTRPNQCVRMPKGTTINDGALVEPLAVALHGVNMSGMRPGDRVLILGAGPIGLSVAFWAKRMGAAHVTVQAIADWQRELAGEMGADAFVAEPDDPVNAAARAMDGIMPDIVFECVGIPGLVEQAAKQVRNRGTILLLGLCTQPDTMNTFAMLSKEVRLVTSAFFTRQDFEASVDVLAAGAVEPRAMITATVPLDQTPRMFEDLKHRTHQCKVLVAP